MAHSPHRTRRHKQSARAPSELAFFVSKGVLGWLGLATRQNTVIRTTFARSTPVDALNALHGTGDDHVLDRPSIPLAKRFVELESGVVDDFLDVELDLAHLTRFQRETVAQCRRIPRGKTVSYGELAALAGSPRAARAVGSTMANNRFPLIVPCHRVVAASGGLGGYSAPRGLSLKRHLLRQEGLTV